MTRGLRPLLLPALVLLAGIAASPGGWAVITVEDLPDYVVAGQPVTLTFSVRQHGVTLLSGLKGRVEAEAGRLEATVAAAPGNAAGRYTATMTFPQAGEWTITIHSGFGDSKLALVPLQAVEPGTGPSLPLPETERGRRLFVAKGCTTCHRPGGAGPDLSGRTYPPDYLRQFLANPAVAARSGPVQMPNLNLKQPEIAALVAFINTERQALR